MDSKHTDHVIQMFDKYAQMYQEKYMSVEKYEDSLDQLCAMLPNSPADILELACGPGNITQYIRSIDSTLNILATDLSPEMLKLTSTNNPEVETQFLDCRAFLTLNKKFDAIICGFGLPYISKEDALQLIADAGISLNPGGLLYLSTMEGEDTSGIQTSSSTDTEDTMITYYHSADYLIQQMKQTGFELAHESRVTYTDESNTEVIDLILIGKLV